MPPDDLDPRNPQRSQSIPLQPLSRPPETAGNGDGRDRVDSYPGSRTRNLLGARRTFSGRVRTHGRYEGVRTGLSIDADTSAPHITTPRTPHFEDPSSPVDVIGFADAMVGLELPVSATTSPIGDPLLRPILEDGSPYTAGTESMGGDDYFAAINDDRTPLTDPKHLQPISGSNLNDATTYRSDRRKKSLSYTRSLLGDGALSPGGLLNRMSGLPLPSMPRPLSTTSNSLDTAKSMLRRMSQRVVNLSYEPDPIEPAPLTSKNALPLDDHPSLPLRTEYRQEDYLDSPPPLEKAPPLSHAGQPQHKWQQSTNPLRGKSLGIFGPDDKLRLWLCEMLVWPATEPIILILIIFQTVLLAVQAIPTLAFSTDLVSIWGSYWMDTAFLALFSIYTLEIGAKIIVSGFVKNATEFSTLQPGVTVRQAFVSFLKSIFSSERPDISRKAQVGFGDQQASIVGTFQNFGGQGEVRGHGRQAQRIRLARRAFLRHSFNRVDLLAVVSFWISLVLSITQVKGGKHIFVFQMLSCLRILRLLNLTNGTSIILRSLKKAAPLLVNVSFFVAFFWLLFAILGVQSFKSSFRRSCHYYGDNITSVLDGNATEAMINASYIQNLAPGNIQLCGGHINYLTNEIDPYVLSDLETTVISAAKGFICPAKSLCVEGVNPYNSTVSFDNVFQSLELVFVVMSSNTFSDLLYYTTNSDSLAGALFFALAFFVLSLWLINLLVAVITSSFQVIREESKTSAFTTDDQILTVEEEKEHNIRKKTTIKRLYDMTYWFWIILIVISLIGPSTISLYSSPSQIEVVQTIEIVVSLMLLVEILLRFISDWRNFHKNPRNWVDLGLAIITSVIQLPQIRRSGRPYAWLTFFQIVRVYRVVLAVPLTRDLIMIVLRNVSGLLNLIIFVFLLCFLAAIFASQLFRGAIPAQDADGNVIRMTFSNIWISFVGMYQVFSSENWTAPMYSATMMDAEWNTAWIDALFFIIWFAFANFIILNMFIAVIQENFDMNEDEKRLQQVKAFLQQKELTGSSHGNLSLANVFKLGREKTRHRDPIDYGPTTIEMFNDSVVIEFLEEQMEMMEPDDGADGPTSKQDQPGFWSRVSTKIMHLVLGKDPNPFYTSLMFSRPYDQLDPRTMAKEIATAAEQRKIAQRRYLQEHPNYNKALFLLKPYHPVRRFCQKLVGPGRGARRIEGIDPVKPYWYTFSIFIYIVIVTMVVLACITTPLFQRDWFAQRNGYTNRNWFVWTDMGFAVIFTIEALIKILADGFLFTPNAYYRGFWGFLDAVVLITLWVSVSASLANLGQISRGVGAVKALRALRLLNISDSARNIFHSVIIQEGWKLLSAAFVSLSLLIPFAIYGLNLFRGQFLICNDISDNIISLKDCAGEYASTPFANQWTVWAPRQVANPYFNFDDFGSALFILFQIVSQEGWVDVMWASMSAVGIGSQPQWYASQGNAVFFIVFNLLGAVFVLTLFISVFMRNYTEQTGVAFLTAEQRSWLELRKLLLQISPSKRPAATNSKIKQWSYRVAVSKHGRWARFITFVLLTHLVLLVLEWYPEPVWWETTRDGIFLLFIFVYCANIGIRIIGLSWKRFRRNSWDLYSLFAVGGSLITTLVDIAMSANPQPVVRQLHKYFLVAIALLLIPRNNQLDQLFKTAAASLSAIGNLLLTWMVLYLVFAIAMTQTLGLTRFSTQETANLNLRTVPKALILLFRMSCGEGWNQIMEDFANVFPPYCNASDDFFQNDCGSGAWAKTLFVAWNLISMYIFVSLFVSLIFESFSYVYQRSSGLQAVSREEIRRFKQAWATFDPDGTGFISKEVFPRLLGELSGIFEMRVYDGEHSVGQLLEVCKVDVRPGEEPPPGVMYGVDIRALNQKLKTINVKKIRQRRQILNTFSQEILVSADPDRGVSFSSCLMILAHYKVINDTKALRLEEFLRRRYRLQRVEEEVRRRIVQGFFDTLHWYRRFQRRHDMNTTARMVDIPQFAVPEIYIDDGEGLHSDQAGDIAGPSSGSRSPAAFHSPGGLALNPETGRWEPQLNFNLTSPTTPGTGRDRTFSFGASPPRSTKSSPSMGPSRPSHELDIPDLGLDGWHSRASSDQQREERPSFQRPELRVSTTGLATGFAPPGFEPQSATTRHRRQQGSGASAQISALDAFDNSAWGESIKRSFTIGKRRARKNRQLGDMPRLGD